MKNTFSIAFLFLFLCPLAFISSVNAQTNHEVEDDEYEVYSAFINQVYLSKFNNEWFTIRGDKSKSFDYIDRIGQVVIFPNTLPEPSNAYFAFANASYRSQIPGKLFENFLKQNRESYKLADKFRVKVRHDIFSQTLEEAQAYSAEAQRRKVSFDVLFLEKYPRALGTLMFFRIGFDESRKNALLGVRQTDIYNPKTGSSRIGDRLVLLSKNSGKWLVKKVFPESTSIELDLNECRPVSKHLWLGLGSTSLAVVGMEKGKCRIREFYEMEGGYSTTDCLVPSALGEVTVIPGDPFVFSRNLSGYCQKPKTGNIFFDELRTIQKTP